MSPLRAVEGPGVDRPTMQAGSALYGVARRPLRGILSKAWPCPCNHWADETCDHCLALARRDGTAFVVDVMDAVIRTEFDTGTHVGFIEVGRLAAEAIAAGIDVGLSGADLWANLHDMDVCKIRGVPVGPNHNPNRWYLLRRRHGIPVTGGFVIHPGQ